MSGIVKPVDDAISRYRHVLESTYWPVCIGFIGVVWAFTRDRACADHLNLLPVISHDMILAVLAAIVYVSGQVWLVGAYALLVFASGELIPRMSDVSRLYSTMRPRIVLLLAVLAIEYAPAALLKTIANAAALCPS
jgi:hypothetical protein